MVDFTKIVKKSIKDETVEVSPPAPKPIAKKPEPSELAKKIEKNESAQKSSRSDKASRPLDHIFGEAATKKTKKKIKYSEHLGTLFGVEGPENE